MVKKVVEEKPLTQADKKKRLKQKMALINKKAGKQVISMATEATTRSRIPFTANELNEASGGGIPRGAFSVLWGGKAAGKTSGCLDLIAHAQGMGLMCQLYDFERCIAEDTEIFEFKSNTIKKIQDISSGDIVLSFDGSNFVLSKVGSNKCNGTKEVFKIKTSIEERTLLLTKEHRVFTKNGWRKVKDISDKDSLASPQKIELPEVCNVNAETGRLVGYMLGDGHMQSNGSYSYATIDKDIVKDISKILRKFHCVIKPEKDGIHYRIVGNKKYKEKRKCKSCKKSFVCYKSENKQFCSVKCGTSYTNNHRKTTVLKKVSKTTPRQTDLKKTFVELGIHGLKREDKVIPKDIMLSVRHTKSECLGGLFSADGYINKDRNLISINNLSHTLLEQIRLLLIDIGIDSRISSYQQEINHKNFYYLTIFGYRNIVKFHKNIRLCKSKQKILNARVKHGKKENSKDSFEYINRDKELPLFWNKITSISSVGRKKVYDVMIPNTENIIINNILIHNSYDPEWAKKFGVDPEYLSIAKFGTAEEGLDNVIDVCKAGIVDLIIIDCYDKETQVLTKDGWKYFKDIKDCDLLLSLDKDHKKANYYPINKIYKQKVKTEMYYYNRRHLDFCMTKNNNILYGVPSSAFFSGWKTGTIDDVMSSDNYKKLFFKKDILWYGEDKELFTFKNDSIKLKKEYNIPMDLWLEFLGWFYSEGSFNIKDNGKNKFYRINISQSKKVHPEFYKEIENILEKLPFKYKKTDDGFYINNSALGRELIKTGRYCIDKDIPRYINDLSPKQIRIFLDAFLKGDGCLNWSGNWTTVIKNEKLAHSLHELFLKSGQYCSINKTIVEKRKKWIVDHWAQVGGEFWNITSYNCNSMSHSIRKEFIETIKYNDYIYDVEVSSPSHMIYIKRNKGSFWASNSIQGMCPKGEYETKKGKEKSIEDDTMALLPRKLSKFFPKAVPFVDGSDCAVVLIGQTRMDLGAFIPLEQLTGGNALLHWSSMIIHWRRGQKAGTPTIKVDNGKKDKSGKTKLDIVPIGFEMVAKVNKSKVGPEEGNEVRLPFYFGSGFVKPEEEEETND